MQACVRIQDIVMLFSVQTPGSTAALKQKVLERNLGKRENYLPAIPLLKMNIPPAVCTNLCLRMHTCVPVYMS